jgi:hypothetical protein
VYRALQDLKHISKPSVALCGIVAVCLLAACADRRENLRLIEPRLPVDRAIAGNFASLLDEESSISITLVPPADNDEPSIEALLADRADIALVSNNQAYTPGVTTVIPLYANILHILQREPAETGDVETSDVDTGDAEVSDADLFTSGLVFAGPPGSPSRLMLEKYAIERQIDPGNIQFLDSLDDTCPNVIVIFAPIIRDIQSRLPCSDYRFYGRFGAPEDIGSGGLIDAATLLNPSLRPFVIPAGTYESVSKKAVVTLAVDKILIARRDVSATVIYDLIGEVLRLQPALAANNPLLFHSLDGDFDSTDSTFILHPGAQAYIQRDEPSVYERYSGIAEVTVTVFFALLSGAFAGVRIYNIRRKNRIDRFYSATLALRQSISDSTPMDQRRDAVSELRALQTEAFEMLVDEKLAADESFRIFITLSNDVIRELDVA